MQNELVEICPTGYHQVATHGIHVWGWEIVVYLFLGGLVAGLMILTAALELQRGERSRSWGLQMMPFIGIGLISLGMVALFLDLGFKVHVYRFYLAFQPASPMSWGAWILMVIYPAAGLMGLGSLSEAGREKLGAWGLVTRLRLGAWLEWVLRIADRQRTRILWINVAAGAALGVYTGLLLGTMVARIQWNSAVLGPLFLASGLSTGAAFMLLLGPTEQEQHTLVRWDMIAIATELFFIILMLISFAGGNATAQMAGDNLLGGSWTALFWTLVVVAGLVVPLLMEIFEVGRKLVPVPLTPVLILMGGVALRAILLYSGQESCFCELR